MAYYFVVQDVISPFTSNVFASIQFHSILTGLILSNENGLESRDPVPWSYTYHSRVYSTLPSRNCRASPSAGGCLGMSDMYGCFYFWRSQTLDKAMSPRMVNWHLPATGPHTEKPRTRYVLLVHGKIKGKSWRYSQLFGNNTKCSCFRDVCLLESQIKAGTNSKCPFYSVRCTRSKRYPCVNCTRKRYPCGHHKMQYQAHGARKDDNSQSLSFLVEVFDSQTTFSLFFFQLTGDQTRFLNWLFWQNLLEQIGLFTIAINYYSEVNTARSMDHFHGAVGTSL